ncbi:MAG TPA: ABC transporter permease subunit [Candidatus Angelobacter sp.]|jgi:NitT/TauT family transport system permease protein|nr:ABC transporter permease subunit [Candidatus Angelobacter sp.]
MILIRSGEFYRDCLLTASEALIGFLMGTAIGTMLGLLLWYSQKISQMAQPYIVAAGSIPVFALGPMLVFWFGTGFASKVALAILATVVIALVQAHTGACQTDVNLIRLMRLFRARRSQVVMKVVGPSAIMWVLAGARINIGMALLGAFIGEFIGSSHGLGHSIIVAEGLFNVSQIWVGVLGIVLIALTFQAITIPIEQWARRWRLST